MMTILSEDFKFLFIINSASGHRQENYEDAIRNFFKDKSYSFEIYFITKPITIKSLKKIIEDSKAVRVIAVGGDGTVNLVANCLIHSDIALGIIPAGSANGMAKELGIPNNIKDALNDCITGIPKKIHLTEINGSICIHLSDLGFNAYVVRMFDLTPGRGMWGYLKATFFALLKHKRMEVMLQFNGKKTIHKAVMIAIANGTMYGSGLQINQIGRLDDKCFEVILIKDYSYLEIFKAWVSKKRFNPQKIEVFQTNQVRVTSKKSAHFQIDGEYIGKITELNATLIPHSLWVLSSKEAFSESDK